MSKSVRDRRSTLNGHYRVLTTAIFIFDSTMQILAGSELDGVKIPHPASVWCVKRILEFSGVGGEDDESLRADLIDHLAALWLFW